MLLKYMTAVEKRNKSPIKGIKNQPWILLHGNTLYNSNYRSYIDTPFAQNNVFQHLVQSNFDFLIKNKYPIRMTVTSRSSNSPFFRNTLDVNFNISQQQILENIKQSYKNQINEALDLNSKLNTNLLNEIKPDLVGQIPSIESLKIELRELALQSEKLVQLDNWLKSPARIQELVEAKELEIEQRNNRNQIDSIAKKVLDATALLNTIEDKKSVKAFLATLEKGYQKEQEKLAAQKSVLKTKENIDAAKVKFQEKYKEVQNKTSVGNKKRKDVIDSLQNIRKEINSVKSTEGLYAFMKKKGITKVSLSKLQRTMLSIKQFGIGRTWLDYSELTVKNISIAGVNIETNPGKYYFAFAAGKVNYRFRDFIFKNNLDLPKQSLALARVGIGKKEKSNIILSVYTGKKSVLNSSTIAATNGIQNIFGYAIEGKYAINEQNYIVAEYGKSSFYDFSNQQPTSLELRKKAFSFKDQRNQAFSIRVHSKIEQTNTKITGYYKKLGEQFQSFNLFPIGVVQQAWSAKVNQQLFKNKIIVEAGIKQNDFSNPITLPNFGNQAVFKSFQITAKVPKYPFVSVGYYPSSQVTYGTNGVLFESQYNTLNAVVSHSYLYKKQISMNTNFTATKFYNSSTDSGFIYFNASSYTVNHSMFLGKLQLQTGINHTNQSTIDLFTLEQTASYQFKSSFSLLGGARITRANKTENLIGAIAGASIKINKVGNIQLNYERMYLPNFSRALVPVNMGQLNFYKEF
jgi:hypothetical protein